MAHLLRRCPNIKSTLLLGTQQTQNICITFVQCWTNVEDVGPTLYKCYANVLCLLGIQHESFALLLWSTNTQVMSTMIIASNIFDLSLSSLPTQLVKRLFFVWVLHYGHDRSDTFIMQVNKPDRNNLSEIVLFSHDWIAIIPLVVSVISAEGPFNHQRIYIYLAPRTPCRFSFTHMTVSVRVVNFTFLYII